MQRRLGLFLSIKHEKEMRDTEEGIKGRGGRMGSFAGHRRRRTVRGSKVGRQARAGGGEDPGGEAPSIGIGRRRGDWSGKETQEVGGDGSD